MKTRDIVTGGLVVLLALVSLLTAPELSEEMAINFDAAGEPNNYAQTETFLAGSVLLAGAIAVMFALVPRVDPLAENITSFQATYDGVAVGTLVFFAYIHCLVLASNLGVEFNTVQVTAPAVAGLYLLLAILLWRAEQNWFVGIRTPWTLSNERVWNQTHRHTAPLFIVAAVLSLGSVLFPEFGVLLLTVPVTVVAFGSMLYSFVLYERLDQS
jgi:uncharacterized membrane protein